MLDANVALHFKRCDQISWQELCGVPASLGVDLIVCPTFLRELEKVRIEHRSESIRRRAADASRWVSDCFKSSSEAEIRPNVRLVFHERDPIPADFTKYNLSELVIDDWLIATALAYVESFGIPLKVATADGPLHLKLRYHHLEPVVLLDDLRLPAEIDPRDQELRDLRRKVAEEEARRPLLSLVFPDGRSRLELAKPQSPPLDPADVFVRKSMENLRSENSRLEYTPSLRQRSMLMFPPSKSDVDRYNAELEKFFKAYEKYSRATWIHKDFLRRAVEVRLTIVNSGQSVATDIDIEIRVPDDVQVWTPDEVPESVREPKPPPIPEPVPAMGNFNMPSFISGHHLRTFDDALRDVQPLSHSGPNVDDDRRLVKYWVKKLKHHRQHDFDPFILVFEHGAAFQNFNCSIEIHSAEMTAVESGRLDFICNE
ncbi:MAG: hypothetical protein WA373_15200 [Burkholderiales bacterium]